MYEGDELVSYKSIWAADDEFEDVDLGYEFPFAGLYNPELVAEFPTNYTERENHIFYRGVWYPVDSADDSDEAWFQFDGQWLPYPEEGSSAFFVDETETIPFAGLTDEELLSLYSPLDYVDPWPEVYDMEYLE